VRACEEVFELKFGAEAEIVRINARELDPRSNCALVTEQALDHTACQRHRPASGYIMLQGFLQETHQLYFQFHS
jgi:hypothetical protein